MLRLSKKMLYAIEAVLDIAYHAGSEPVQSREITRRQGIPRRYLEQALQQLVRHGILIGVRGPRGGYRLARERRRITIGDIVKVVREVESGDVKDDEICRSELGGKIIRPLVDEMQASMMEKLNAVTIEDLCSDAYKADIRSEGRRSLDFAI